MKYNIKSIETYYAGQLFKSRLEARWACFFDLCGWKWAYEPCKIKNRIPDFILNGVYCNIITEVKPSVFVDNEFVGSLMDNYKVTDDHVLILTDKPFSEEKDEVIISYGFQCCTDYCIPDNYAMKTKNDFSSVNTSWTGMMYENTSRKSFLNKNSYFDIPEMAELQSNWFSAGDTTKLKTY